MNPLLQVILCVFILAACVGVVMVRP